MGEPLFEILHTRDFNPNSKDFVVFQNNVLQQNIGLYLAQLCDQFYDMQTGRGAKQSVVLPETVSSTPVNDKQVYQCKNCLTLYDETYGDSVNHISAGTKFENIDSYICPTCDAPKQDFVLLEESPVLN